MSARTAAPFRADHVGSLLRPKALYEARAKAKKGEISAAELKKAEDQHIREVVGFRAASRNVFLEAHVAGKMRFLTMRI